VFLVFTLHVVASHENWKAKHTWTTLRLTLKAKICILLGRYWTTQLIFSLIFLVGWVLENYNNFEPVDLWVAIYSKII